MINVKDLVLARNLIEELPEDAFQHLANLEIIDLSFNKLHRLHKGTFVNNPKLKIIYANDNQIEILEADLFSNNQNLLTIIFDNNQLIAIKTLFDIARSYDLISFRDNLCIDTSYPSFKNSIEINELYEEIFVKCYGPGQINPRRK